MNRRSISILTILSGLFAIPAVVAQEGSQTRILELTEAAWSAPGERLGPLDAPAVEFQHMRLDSTRSLHFVEFDGVAVVLSELGNRRLKKLTEFESSTIWGVLDAKLGVSVNELDARHRVVLFDYGFLAKKPTAPLREGNLVRLCLLRDGKLVEECLDVDLADPELAARDGYPTARPWLKIAEGAPWRGCFAFTDEDGDGHRDVVFHRGRAGLPASGEDWWMPFDPEAARLEMPRRLTTDPPGAGPCQSRHPAAKQAG